jgi:DNA-binding CsgD family transcriptional regulator
MVEQVSDGARSPGALGGHAALSLVGRHQERKLIERLLQSAVNGESRVLVILGEPGVGKTALLDSIIEAATRFRIVRTIGIESDVELPFAATQQLCAPILELRQTLPAPQRVALEVAFGLADGPAPNAFLVGLAVLGLLAATDRPLLCVIDDAQWLDRSSAAALSIVARRLTAESVVLLVAARDVGPTFAGLPELTVRGLGRTEARALLESVLPAPMDGQVLDRVVVETGGNPLALLELPRGLSPAQLAGGFGLPAAVPLHAGIEERFIEWFAALPTDARRLVLLAAADPTGDAALIWRAAQQLGISEAAALTAESDGLVAFADAITFRHPLVRSAVYRAASAEERSEAHRAIAASIDPRIDPDRRAWHRSQGTTMPDEEVASDLSRSATRAQARGGFAAAAVFLERSSALTLEPARRAERALAAAQARRQAGGLEDALRLLAIAEAGPLDPLQRAQAEVLRARILFASERGRDAPAMLLAAAKRLDSLDPGRAREVYLDALTAALFAGRLAGEYDTERVARVVREAPPVSSDPRPVDLLLEGLAALITDGFADGQPILQRAVAALQGGRIASDDQLRWLWVAGRTAGFMWDYESWDSLTAKQVRAAREAGAVAELPLALVTRVGVKIFGGDLRAAAALVDEADDLSAAIDGRVVPPYGRLSVTAFRGREHELAEMLRVSIADFRARGEGLGLTLAHWVSAAMHNGAGRYDEAFAAASEAAANPRELWFSSFGLVELIEAASRSGRNQEAGVALRVLLESTQVSGTPWALGVEARSRALLQDGDAAEALYREAIQHLEPTRLQLDLARSHLVYGEWLRRERRRLDARSELRLAHEMLADFGMDAFVERARTELEATGEHARKRTVDTLDQLTPQEAQVSRLAALGNTNREIAAQLFITPSTVEYHLRKAFRKLDVTSRTQLARRLP